MGAALFGAECAEEASEFLAVPIAEAPAAEAPAAEARKIGSSHGGVWASSAPRAAKYAADTTAAAQALHENLREARPLRVRGQKPASCREKTRRREHKRKITTRRSMGMPPHYFSNPFMSFLAWLQPIAEATPTLKPVPLRRERWDMFYAGVWAPWRAT